VFDSVFLGYQLGPEALSRAAFTDEREYFYAF